MQYCLNHTPPHKNSGGLQYLVRFRGTAMPTQHTKTLSPPSNRTRMGTANRWAFSALSRCVENWQFSESDTIALNAIGYKIKRTRPLSYSLANVVKIFESAMMLYNTFTAHLLQYCCVYPCEDYS